MIINFLIIIQDHTMNNLQNHIENYLDYCRTQKCLDKKTLKAYRIDLRQFSEQISVTEASDDSLVVEIDGLLYNGTINCMFDTDSFPGIV